MIISSRVGFGKFTSINPNYVRNRMIQVYNRRIAEADPRSDGHHLLTSISERVCRADE